MIKKPVKYMGKRVGFVEGFTYYTERRPVHLFRKFNGFGLSEKIIRALEQEGVDRVSIKYFGKLYKVYGCKLAFFREMGIRHTDTTRGEIDAQWILPIKYMEDLNEQERLESEETKNVA
jgi:hypothetical protein